MCRQKGFPSSPEHPEAKASPPASRRAGRERIARTDALSICLVHVGGFIEGRMGTPVGMRYTRALRQWKIGDALYDKLEDLIEREPIT